jgi:hypothetical protein
VKEIKKKDPGKKKRKSAAAMRRGCVGGRAVDEEK